MKTFLAISLVLASSAVNGQDCPIADRCLIKNGECTSQDQCVGDNLVWDPALCEAAGVDGCGCCFSPEPICMQTDPCYNIGGVCTSKEECDPTVSTCDETLCDVSNDPDVSCVCKAPPQQTEKPTTSPAQVCEPSDECKLKGGKCVSFDECPSDMIYEPRLCSVNGQISDECGCCMPRETAKPTTSPAQVCEPSDECKLKGGKCVSFDECPSDMIYEPRLCSVNGQISDECGCCMPRETAKPTTSPTPPPTFLPTQSPTMCPQTRTCKAFNGDCVSKEACDPRKFTCNWKLCNLQEEGDCVCRIPLRPTPAPTPCRQDRRCKLINRGRCVSAEECDPLKYDCNDSLCGKGGDGCVCMSEKIEPTPPPTPRPKPCRQDLRCRMFKGRCVSKEQCNPLLQNCDARLCGNSEDGCVCMYDKFELPITKNPTCTVKDRRCERIGGKCTSRKECPAGLPWTPLLCSSKRSAGCGCCVGA